MCLCYWQKCEGCDKEVPVHLADGAMEKSDIRVFCSKHIPRDDVVVFRLLENDPVDYAHFRKGSRLGFRYKVPLPGRYTYADMCPNVGVATELTVLGNPIV